MSKIKVVHYINQFFAGIGGEEKADYKPEYREGFVGPGMALNAGFGENAEVIGTIICGDSYFNENLEEAKATVLNMVKEAGAELFVAGPAFNAGRYGAACGTICKEVQEKLNIPVLTAMYIENPGVDMYRKDLYIVETANSAAAMRTAVPAMVKLALKIVNNEAIGTPAEEGYIERGVRRNVFVDKIGAERAVDMLVAKLSGNAFVTEYPMPVFDNVVPGKAILDMSKAKVALVTSGGIVPKGNPDRIESSSASKFGRYNIEGVYDLTEATYETAHGGFDPIYCNEDSDRVLPVDVLRDLEKEGKIGSLYPFFFSTTGNGTSVKNSNAFADEFAQELLAQNVDAVILTST
jgi:betaine reductase